MMQFKPEEERDIIAGCKKQNRQAQEILYRTFADKMYRICLSYSGDRDAAKDILQESFVKVFRKIDTFNEGGPIEGWIRRIVTNTAIDHYRKAEKIQKTDNYEDAAEKDIESSAEQLSLLHKEVILDFIKKLPEGARNVFNLFAIEGYSHKEIASKLNISEGTSKSQYNRARSLLKTWINEDNT
jgi:RNA polymerase sigma-70 factor (ECF subfamily)